MKRLIWLLLLGVCFGQGYNAYQTSTFTTTASATRVFENSTILYHQLSWTKTGTVSTCTIAVDSSPDNVTWTPGGIITGQTCTSNGNSVVTSGSAVYIRVTVTVFSGGGSLAVVYKGWTQNPAPGTGTVTSITCGTGLTCSPGSPITTVGTINASGGSVACSTVTFSATPTFDGTGGVNCFKITLTGDVTSSTFSNGVNGTLYTFIVTQDATGGRAFVPPTSMKQYSNWMALASSAVAQQFVYDGTNLTSTAPWTIDTRPFTPGALDDEFDGNTLNVSSKWTWPNQGTSTAALSNGMMKFFPQAGNGADLIKFVGQTVPATPYTVTAKLQCFAGSGNTNQIVGIGLTDGTKYTTFAHKCTTSAVIELDNWTNDTTFSSTVFTTNSSNWVTGTWIWLRLTNNGTNILFSYSPNGINYSPTTSVAVGSFLGTITKVGIASDVTQLTSQLFGTVDYFRQQ